MTTKFRPCVGDLMTAPARTATPTETVAAAASRMAEAGVGSLVVVSDEAASMWPIGILTERDLLRCAGTGVDPTTGTVGEWMTADPDVLDTADSIDEAWGRFAAAHYRHLPVVAGGELKGIVSVRDVMGLAQLRPADEPVVVAPPGLKGVVVAETALGDVRGAEGFYHYRQYSAPDLAATRTFEDVWQLLIDNELPDLAARAAFAAEVGPLRSLPAAALGVLPTIASASPSISAGLRTMLSLVAATEDLPASLDASPAQLRDQALRLSAVVPTIIAALHRARSGLEPIVPRHDLGYAACYLWMLDGVEPDPVRARAIEQYLILGIDHGFNASTFTARVVTSTGADLGAALVAALGSLSGPLHGGAPSRALDTLDAIGSPDRTAAWVRAAVAKGDRIMGFGHPVYRTADPRSVMLRSIAQNLAAAVGGAELVDFAVAVEAEVERTLAELKPGRALHTNVEWYAAVVMQLCGLPRDLFTPTFAAARVVGWCAQAMEQAADNRIIRPSSRYIGPPPPQPVPPI